MTTQRPQVSIGLPVYNGENFLAAAIESILAQTFQDFELIICDNASTDQTEAICRHYAAQDDRIRYYRNDRNLGAAPNYNRTFDLATGQYFKWAAHDDLCGPTFLEACVAVLDQDPGVVLCHPGSAVIDEQGQVKRPYRYNGKLRTDADRPSIRFTELVHTPHHCFQIFGLIRSDIFAQTPRHGDYGHQDGVLLARLALMGRFHEIPELLFFPRKHPAQSTYRFCWSQKRPDYRAFAIWADVSRAGTIMFPKWRIFWEYCLAITQVPLPVGERLLCYGQMVRWARVYWKGLLWDLAVAVGQAIGLLTQRFRFRDQPMQNPVAE